MTSPNEPRTASLYHEPRARTFDPWTAGLILPAAVASYLAVGNVAPRSAAVLAAQLALAATPIAAALWLRRAAGPDAAPRVRDALGLRAAPLRYGIAAIAIGATAWYLNMRVVALLPITEAQTRELSRLIERPPLVAAIAMFAAVPAVCEELVFRGVFARALGRDLPLAGAAAISAAVFSAYHLSVAQALPTLTLGVALAILAIRSGSVLPAMLAHAINNAAAIAVSRDEVPALSGWLADHPIAALAIAIVVAAGGLALALPRASRAPITARSNRPTGRELE